MGKSNRKVSELFLAHGVDRKDARRIREKMQAEAGAKGMVIGVNISNGHAEPNDPKNPVDVAAAKGAQEWLDAEGNTGPVELYMCRAVVSAGIREYEDVPFWDILQELERKEAERMATAKDQCQATVAAYVASFNIVGSICTELASKILDRPNDSDVSDLVEVAKFLSVANVCAKMAETAESIYTGPELNSEIVHDIFRDALNLYCPDAIPETGQPSKPAGGKRPSAQA